MEKGIHSALEEGGTGSPESEEVSYIGQNVQP
jgi:hypothetical protein